MFFPPWDLKMTTGFSSEIVTTHPCLPAKARPRDDRPFNSDSKAGQHKVSDTISGSVTDQSSSSEMLNLDICLKFIAPTFLNHYTVNSESTDPHCFPHPEYKPQDALYREKVMGFLVPQPRFQMRNLRCAGRERLLHDPETCKRSRGAKNSFPYSHRSTKGRRFSCHQVCSTVT